MQLSEDRAHTISAEFSRIAQSLRECPDGDNAAIAAAVERANSLGASVTFMPEYVSVNLPFWTSAACARTDRPYTAALEVSFRQLAERAAYELREGNVYKDRRDA